MSKQMWAHVSIPSAHSSISDRAKDKGIMMCDIPYSRVIRRPSLISAASLLGAALLLAPSYSLLGLQVHYSRLVIGK